MAKEKKIVKVEKSEKLSGSFGLDENKKIIKVEDKGDRKERAKSKRILAIVLWVLAITCEVFGILRLTDKINWLDKVPFVIGAIVLDLAFFIPGSLLWKKANHIDPISEKNKAGFWCWNNLGTLLSVLAFLPIIIFVLMNKDLDKKDKTIVTAVAAVALLVAGISSYDFNPVSSEQLEKAQKEVEAVGTHKNEKGEYVVYWAKTGKKYHVDPDCPAFSRSEEVYEGTVADAYERNLTDPCRRCIPELEDDHDHDKEE